MLGEMVNTYQLGRDGKKLDSLIPDGIPFNPNEHVIVREPWLDVYLGFAVKAPTDSQGQTVGMDVDQQEKALRLSRALREARGQSYVDLETADWELLRDRVKAFHGGMVTEAFFECEQAVLKAEDAPKVKPPATESVNGTAEPAAAREAVAAGAG